jgi:putative DNA primase/helicase
VAGVVEACPVTPFERAAAALEAKGARHHGRDWTCPSHDDDRPSLSVACGRDGAALLHCHAGCATEDVVAALGLTMADLFPDDGKLREPTIAATYDYTDESGTVLYQVLRYYPKSFRQRRPDGNGGWAWKLGDTTRVLYRLPKVVQAAQDGQRVYVVEGEKDVHALERAGAVATCNPGGAGKWREEFSRFLVGADVVVVADDDTAGRDHAEQVRASLSRAGVHAPVVAPRAGKDASDHLAAGFGLSDLAPAEASPQPPRAVLAATVRASSVHPERVSWLWAGRVPLGMVTVVGGLPGVGKSTVNYDLAARCSREGKPVLVATAEDHLAAVLRPRLEAAGADLELVHIVTVPLTLPEGVALLRRLVEELGAALVILDPLVAFIGDTVNTHRDHHVRRVLAPLADLAEGTGAAVLVVIHTNKGMDSEPLMRISGSVGFTGAARSVLLAADDPNDEGRRILAVVKSNLAAPAPPLAYRLAEVTLDSEIVTSKVEWLGEAPEVDVRALLSRRDLDDRTALGEAIEYLRDAGVTEWPRPAKELERDASEGLGIGYRTLRRAREALGVPAWRDRARWYWGPRPEEGDRQRGHATPVRLFPSDLPAEMGSPDPKGDKPEVAGEAPSRNGHGKVPSVKRLIAELLSDGLNRERVAAKLNRLGYPPPNGHADWNIGAVIEAQEFRA